VYAARPAPPVSRPKIDATKTIDPLHCSSGEAHCGEEIEVDDLDPFGVGEFGRRTLEVSADVVDQDVDASKRRQALGDKTITSPGVGEIVSNADHVEALAAHRRHGEVELAGVPCARHNPAPLGCE
jgi:hypothetical protein